MIKLFDALTMNWGRDLGRKYKTPKRGDVETEARSVSAQDRAGQTAAARKPISRAPAATACCTVLLRTKVSLARCRFRVA